MNLVVGLGNIGPRYANTRHNIGFMIVDEIAANLGAKWQHQPKLRAHIAGVEVDGEKLILAKPDTFMNLSGEAIARIANFYKVSTKTDLWVIVDDLDTEFGRLRLRFGGSSGGHQGLSSTIAHIGTDFTRVRVGISLNDRATMPSEVYVLSPFSNAEQQQLAELTAGAARYVLSATRTSNRDETTIELIPKA
jgi:PTH1 family peptidyl-tRNA hydrolase